MNLASRPILVVGPSWVGDMVMAQPLFKLLKRKDPERAIHVLAPKWSIPVVERMPEVQSCHPSKFGHGKLAIGARRKAAEQLRALDFAQAIVLPRSFKAALVPWFADIPVRTGFKGESRYVLINDRRDFDKAAHRRTVDRFAALGMDRGVIVEDVPTPSLRVDADEQRRLIRALSLDANRRVVALMPGAEYGPSKRWPPEYFRELATRYAETGRQVWVLGSEKDRPVGDEIAVADNVMNLCGKTSLSEVVDLLALCERAVSNDSGLMHIAAAVGIRVHAIFGSTSPALTPPIADRKHIHFVDVECGPCFKRVCKPGHHRCMREITPAEVFATDID